MMAARFEEKRSKSGSVYYLITRAELEHLPGFRSSAGGKARAACPFHGGDNPQALEIDFEQGTAHCYTRSCFARIVDSADDYGAPLRAHTRSHIPNRSRPPEMQTNADNPARAGDTIAKLAAAFERARAALPTSPAVAYLERRGIPLELAARYGLGWSTAGSLANRLIFPLSSPDGTITSASGRILSDSITPKYLNLGEKAGYVKGWFHAQAIARAREITTPVFVCEGVFDALALLAGGLETATAIMGKHDPRLAQWLAQWVSGAPRVVLCPDEDEDGGGRVAYEKAARELMLYVPAIVAPRGYLDDCKDLGEFWQTHRTLPHVLAELAFSQAPAQGSPYATERDESPVDDSQYLRPAQLTPELEGLLKREWFIAPVPVHVLSSDECRALARCGQPYEVTGAPLCEPLPAACIGGQVCAALGQCERAPHCRIDAPTGATE